MHMKLAVTSLGMVTVVGNAVSGCAALRAGVTRTRALDEQLQVDENTLEIEPISGCVIKAVTDGFEGIGRLIRLGTPAMADLNRNRNGVGSDASAAAVLLLTAGDYYDRTHLRISMADDPMFDVLEENRREEVDTFRRDVEHSVVSAICEANGVAFSRGESRCFYGGPAAFAQLLREAADLIASSRVKSCIVGGIDSLVSGFPLSQPLELGLVRTPNRSSGFFPGEAAGFVQVEDPDAASERGAETLALIGSPATETDERHRFSETPPDGGALASVISTALQGDTDSLPLRLLIGNLNGDDYRARNFGAANAKLGTSVIGEDVEQWYPVMSFGETGAATGALATCVAVRGLVRGYSKSPSVLVWLTSDDGNCSAFLVNAANGSK